MANSIQSFVTAQNISLYKNLLKQEAHPDKRRILLELLENELAKLPEAARRAEMARAASLR
jgi:hypothetical protein